MEPQGWLAMSVGVPAEPAVPLRLVDRLMLGYLAVAILVAITRMPVKPWAPWFIGAYLLVALLVFLLHRPGLGGVGRVLRTAYPIVILPSLYGSLDLLNGFDIPAWDRVIQGWEVALFGGQVSRAWWQSAPSAFWSTVFHAVYFAYYFVVPFPVIYFLLRREPEKARTAVTIIVATFLACYVCFLVIPVAGPYYEFPRPTGPFVDNWAARLVYATLAQGSSYGAAFPSSHVAATLAATIGTWLGSRRIGLVLAIPTLLLAIGVVYCQMHYAVDALAGLLIPVPIAMLVLRDGTAA